MTYQTSLIYNKLKKKEEKKKITLNSPRCQSVNQSIIYVWPPCLLWTKVLEALYYFNSLTVVKTTPELSKLSTASGGLSVLWPIAHFFLFRSFPLCRTSRLFPNIPLTAFLNRGVRKLYIRGFMAELRNSIMIKISET